MAPEPVPRSSRKLLAPIVADEALYLQMQAFGVSATIERTVRGIVLQEVASRYYGKQTAQEIVTTAGLTMLTNCTRVERVDSIRLPAVT
jgi:hypothetical protein